MHVLSQRLQQTWRTERPRGQGSSQQACSKCWRQLRTMASDVGPDYWFNHTGCLRDRDLDMDRWVLWFHVEPLTVHLNRDGTNTYCLLLFWFRSQSLLSRYRTQPVWLHHTASSVTSVFQSTEAYWEQEIIPAGSQLPACWQYMLHIEQVLICLGVALYSGDSPPMDRMTDRHIWKHYLPATSLSTGKKAQSMASIMVPAFNEFGCKEHTPRTGNYLLKLH